jgi:hypothetical protein
LSAMGEQPAFDGSSGGWHRNSLRLGLDQNKLKHDFNIITIYSHLKIIEGTETNRCPIVVASPLFRCGSGGPGIGRGARSATSTPVARAWRERYLRCGGRRRCSDRAGAACACAAAGRQVLRGLLGMPDSRNSLPYLSPAQGSDRVCELIIYNTQLLFSQFLE